MNRQQKEAVVADFKDMFSKSNASFVIKYRGLGVKEISGLRKALRDNGGRLKITKARLMKIAADGIDGIDSFRESFCNQIGLVFALDEVPTVAKQLVNFSKDSKALEVVAGFFESRLMSKDEVEFFASLPCKDALMSQIASGLQSPASNIARAIVSPMQQLASALDQLSKGAAKG